LLISIEAATHAHMISASAAAESFVRAILEVEVWL